MGDKKRKHRKIKKIAKKSGQLPSSVQALLGYLGGGGPTPMYQNPVQLPKERAGIDSIETLSQIIRQQNLMNASYMQNMERLAFKNEIQQQLKTQGEEQRKEITKATEETKQVLQETTKRIFKTTEQKKEEVLKSLAWQQKRKTPDVQRMEALQEKLQKYNQVLGVTSDDLQFGTYDAPLSTKNIEQNQDSPAPVSNPSLFNLGFIQKSVGPVLYSTPIKVDPAVSKSIESLPAIDRNKPLLGQLQKMSKRVEKSLNKIKGPSQEIETGLALFGFKDQNQSSGAF